MPFGALHHSPLPRAVETADIVGRHLSGVPRHGCDHARDRTPVPTTAQRAEYPARALARLDSTPDDERDEGAVALQAAVEQLGRTGDDDRHELVVTHNFVIGWFVRHVLQAPTWRWIGLDQANCALTILRRDADRPPALVCFNDVGPL